MKKQILTLILSVLPTFAFAVGGSVHFDSAPIDTSDMESVKRGAKHFVDYCFSCHGAAPSWHARFDAYSSNCTSCHATIHGSNLSKIFLK